VHAAQAIAATGLIGLIGLVELIGGSGCRGKPAHKDFGPRFFSGASRVPCSKGVDRDHEWTHEALAASLERARAEGIVLHTFGHAPKLDLGEYAADFDWAAAHGVQMVTFRELAAGHAGAGWAFTVDDDEVDAWYGWRDQLRAHHVKVTFFVTRYDRLTERQKQELHDLAADGHDIEAHGKAHENAVDYVAAHGLEAYLRDEVRPSKAALVADGYAPVAFAYPYGAHTAAIDAALVQEFALVRTTGGAWCLK
jgi:Polysaccharide deacetylase